MTKQALEALRLAHEALSTCSEGDYTTGHVIHPSFDEEKVAEALAAVDAAIAGVEGEQAFWDAGLAAAWKTLHDECIPASDRYVRAIKAHREASGSSLKDAKNAVDDLKSGHIRPPVPASTARSASPDQGATPNPSPALKDHEIRETINQLRDVALKYHATQQLRERIAQIVRPLLVGKAGNPSPCPAEKTLPTDLAQRVTTALECGVLWTEGSEAHPRMHQAWVDFAAWLAAGKDKSNGE